jgi:hypothetical protein
VLNYSKDGSVDGGNDQVSVSNITVLSDIENYDNLDYYEIDDTEARGLMQYARFTTDRFVYKRNFADTEWQAIYLPFRIPYNALENDFEVAIPNDVHQYDDDNDGIVDRTVFEAIKVKGGTLMANFPYLIKADEDGEKVLEFLNAELAMSEENSYDISSLNTKYCLNGTYSGVTGSQMVAKNYYAVKNGVLTTTSDTSESLSPYRWYMSTVNNAPNSMPQRSISIRILDKGTTDIEDIEKTKIEKDVYYDLSGRRVYHPEKGIYIINGKKVLVK